MVAKFALYIIHLVNLQVEQIFCGITQAELIRSLHANSFEIILLNLVQIRDSETIWLAASYTIAIANRDNSKSNTQSKV